MTGSDAERTALGALLARHDETAAWAALTEDGWLDLVPEDDGSWPLVEAAAVVADVVARSGRSLPVGAHLAAACALPAELRQGSLGVAVDVHGSPDGRRVGRGWCGASPDALVVPTQSGGLGVVRQAGLDVRPDPMPSFAEVDVRRVAFAEDAVQELGGPDLLAVHEARVAYLLAVEALGALDDVIGRTIVHLQGRRAFGQPLAGFQVLQHRVVDMHAAGLMGGALLDLAGSAWRTGADPDGLSWSAKLFAGGRGVWAAEQAVQLHGAIGFTWELGLHLALRRAQRARLLLGGPSRAGAEVVASAPVDARPGLTDWTLRDLPD